MPPNPPSLSKQAVMVTGAGVWAYGHRKIHEVEHENVGVEGAHKTELLAEAGAHKVSRYAKRRIREHPARQVRKWERRTMKANADLHYQKMLQENPELNSTFLSRMAQKWKIKREYAKQAREAARQTAKAAGAATTTEKAAAYAAQFVRRHKGGAVIVLLLFCLFLILNSVFSALPSLGTGMMNAVVGTSYTAEDEAKAAGLTAVGIGEMGIGNTTTSSAVLCALTGASVADVTGRGGGLTDEGYQKKLAVIEAALALHRPDANDPIDVLTKVGGLDLAAMTGAYLGCAAEHIPAVVDGFISIVAALCAVRLCPAARDYLILSHASYEIGYRIAAEELRQEPCLLLEMRLGEGSGCPLMFQIMRAACAVLCEMATFEEASIHDGYLDEIRKTDAFTVARP